MDLYTRVAYDLARRLTLDYSTSFGLASRLYARSLRPAIYAIYGMVRVADEIVDTYTGADKAVLLEGFVAEVTSALTSGYSANTIVHAFADTARRYSIGHDLIDPFFASMRMDLTQKTFTSEDYDAYIYGSAEVIGLMCLRVFCGDNVRSYETLAPGARLLGNAYQKVNFLRDVRSDYEQRGRVYFPDLTFETFDDVAKAIVIADITHEFNGARASIDQLPRSARRAVRVSFRYYSALLQRLSAMDADAIKQERASVPSLYKLWVFATTAVSLR